MALTLTSPAFADGATIPKRYTCDADDLSPALLWTGAPTQTQSLALIVDDPDAPSGTWTHWLVWNIPPGARQLPEAVPKTETLDNGAAQGRNDFRRIGYGGPCPPPGKPHRYFFKLYALKARLNLKPGASKAGLEQALKAHILAQAQLMGTYR
jgi:Raf kinase inhibitor-like YbhB/YbcL family protein